MCIDLVLADPYPMMLEGLAQAFHGSSEFSVKSCVTNGEEALLALHLHRPHVLVMDLSLSHRTGLALLSEIKTQNLQTKPVVFTGSSIGEVVQALDLNVQGLISKEKPKDLLAHCIKFVHAGGQWLDRDLAAQTMALLLAQKRQKNTATQLLTPREMTVARMVTQGLPNKKIATQLAISEGTAKLHLHHIYQKLSCPGRMALQRCMQEQGLS